MARWNIQVIGSEETKAQLRKVTELVNGEAAQRAILPAAELVRDIAKHLVSIGPGKRKDGSPRKHLRELIFAAMGRRPAGLVQSLASAINGDPGPSVIAGIDLKKAPHAHLVEFGHGGPHPAPAQPFMRPAADSARPLARQIVEDGLRKLLAPFSHF